MLVKELQGLGLRVDLLDEQAQIDADALIAKRSADLEEVISGVEADSEVETVRDEADGEFEEDMNIQDIDEIEEFKEEA